MKKILKIIVVAAIVATLLFSLVYAGPNYESDYDYDDDEGFFDMLTGIINDIANLPSTIANMVATAISALMEATTLSLINKINDVIITFFVSLESTLTDSNLDLNNSIVNSIFNVLRPTSTTFAVLFLIIQVTKSAATFEALDITRTMKYLLFFVLAIFFIDNSLNVLSLIVNGFGSMTRRILDLGYITFAGGSFKEDFMTSFSTGGSSIADSFGALLLSLLMGIFVLFTALSLYITLAIRSIEILIMAATSGLFASTLASDATIDVFKSFIKTFVATVSSTLFMAIGFALFTSVANIKFLDGDYSYVDSVIKMTAILVYCSKTPQTVRNILGYGSPAVNALSVVKSLMFY